MVCTNLSQTLNLRKQGVGHSHHLFHVCLFHSDGCTSSYDTNNYILSELNINYQIFHEKSYQNIILKRIVSPVLHSVPILVARASSSAVFTTPANLRSNPAFSLQLLKFWSTSNKTY